MIQYKAAVLALFLCIPRIAWAATDVQLTALLKEEIAKVYPGSSIDIISPVRWIYTASPTEISAVSILQDDARGNILFSVKGSNNSVNQGWVSFAAWLSALTASRRLRPGELLSNELFVTKRVNVASGEGREYRGVILPADTDLAKLETTQTILESQFLTSSAVERIPDIRKGDSVRIHLVSGSLVLSTLGVAEEAGFFKRQLRVMTNKGKRELLGQLQPNSIVEVKL